MRPRVLLALSAGVAIALLAYAVLAPSGVPRLHELEAERAQLARDTAARAADNERLAEQARVLRGEAPSSPAVLEKAAREELGMIKPGELVVVLPPAPAPPPAAPAAAPKSAAP